MRTKMQEFIKYLERKQALEKAFIAQEIRHMEDTTWSKGRISMLGVVLSEARRLEADVSQPVQYGAAKRNPRK